MDQKMDAITNMVTYTGFANITYKNLSMPLSVKTYIVPTNIDTPKFRFTFNPFLNTMEVKTFFEILNVSTQLNGTL